MVNPPPVHTSVDKEHGGQPFGINRVIAGLSAVWEGWFSYLTSLLNFIVDYTQASVQTPVNGFTITVPTRTQVLQLTPAGVLATGTVITSSDPYNGQVMELLSTKTITAFTLTANAGQTVVNAPTTLIGGTGVAYYYNSAMTTWFRRY